MRRILLMVAATLLAGAFAVTGLAGTAGAVPADPPVLAVNAPATIAPGQTGRLDAVLSVPAGQPALSIGQLAARLPSFDWNAQLVANPERVVEPGHSVLIAYEFTVPAAAGPGEVEVGVGVLYYQGSSKSSVEARDLMVITG